MTRARPLRFVLAPSSLFCAFCGFLRPFILLALAAALTGCAARVSKDPLKEMTDRELDPMWRMDAAQQAEAEFPDDPRRITALNKLVWDRGYPASERNYAIDQLLAIDEADFRKKLDGRILLIPYGEPLDHIYRVGKQRKWPELTPMLVKRWAVPQHGEPDDGRKERGWIAELNPGRKVEDVVFDVFTSPTDQITDLQRIGAWALLNRIASKEQLIAALGRAPQDTVLVTDLKAAGSDLHTLPRHREGVKWLYALREPARAGYWQTAKASVAKLSAAQRSDIEMRHLAILPHLGADTLAADRAVLFRELLTEVNRQQHYLTSPAGGSMSRDYPQQLLDSKDKVTWADLAAMKTLWRLVNEPAVKAQLFAQADRDRADRGAEHGGVLDVIDGTPVAKEYPPLLRVSHDRQFTPSEQMIQHCYTGLAHYHFHAQEKNNTEYAGPGAGDLATADRLDFNFLVFTSIDENRLNVDYYQPRGVVVDLGTIRR